jgi:GNAT superfamily N-acetyltransferase
VKWGCEKKSIRFWGGIFDHPCFETRPKEKTQPCPKIDRTITPRSIVPRISENFYFLTINVQYICFFSSILLYSKGISKVVDSHRCNKVNHLMPALPARCKGDHNMSDILEEFSTKALTEAIKKNLFEYYEYLGSSPKAELHEDSYLKWVFTGIPYSFLNNVLFAHLTANNVDEVIRQTLANFRSRNITNLSWWTEPGTQPTNLGEYLVRNGLVYDNGEPGMAVDLLKLNEVLVPKNLTVKRVDNVEALSEFVHTSALGFGLPETSENICFELFAGLGFDLPLINYVGYLSGKPVATAELFLAAGVAGIYWVSTIPEVRRQGIGLAMTQTPLQQAREMGYHVGILHSSELGISVYRQLGFVEKCKMGHYIWNSK